MQFFSIVFWLVENENSNYISFLNGYDSLLFL